MILPSLEKVFEFVFIISVQNVEQNDHRLVDLEVLWENVLNFVSYYCITELSQFFRLSWPPTGLIFWTLLFSGLAELTGNI